MSDSQTEELLVTQRAFRVVLDAMARPGLVCCVQPLFQATLANPWLETLTQMLIDSTCGFCVAAADEGALIAAIATRSYAKQVPSELAHFAIITADANPVQATRVLRSLSGGTDDAPERGATALVECNSLGAAKMPKAPQAQWFSVTGPGVRCEHLFCATDPWWYAVRNEREDEFPCGIDIVLIDLVGRVVALPRTAQLQPVSQPEEVGQYKDASQLKDASQHKEVSSSWPM